MRGPTWSATGEINEAKLESMSELRSVVGPIHSTYENVEGDETEHHGHSF